jgi:hypothetical protein
MTVITERRSLTLYELGEEWHALEAALLDAGGELTPDVEAAFAALGHLEGAKVDSYAAVLRTFAAYATALQVEEAALRAKRHTADAAIERLKGRLLEYMRERGVRELRGHTWRAAIQRNGGLRPMALVGPVEDLPAVYRVVTVTPDWPAIRAAVGELAPPPDLGGQVALPGTAALCVNIQPVGEHCRIR